MNPSIENSDQYLAQTYKRPPFVLSHGQGTRLWDDQGREYLDMVSGIAVMALGHSDPQISAIIRDQAEQLIHVSNLYHNAPQAALAAALVEKSFADRVFFCNSGAEANEGAIKFARKYAYANGQIERHEIISFSHAFHGRTMGALAVTPKPAYQDPFRPLIGGAKTLPVNDIAAAQAGITSQTCAVILEPIQGEGGVRPIEREFMAEIRRLCDEQGALLIFDEVQCGLGRTGKLWAHEHYGITPDIMTLAKPLANGLPMGAVLMTERVHSALLPGDHGSTFAGGALSCAVALHVLERISDPQFLAHVEEVGTYLHERLSEINSPHIKDIRGEGLMLGVELDFAAAELISEGYNHGLLLVNAGAETLRLIPPLIINKADIDIFIDKLSLMLLQR